jgi:hypothetical protein
MEWVATIFIELTLMAALIEVAQKRKKRHIFLFVLFYLFHFYYFFATTRRILPRENENVKSQFSSQFL